MRIQYQITPEEEAELRRGQPEDMSLNQVAHRDYQRYRSLLVLCQQRFVEDEALLICQALRSLIPTTSPQFLEILPSWVEQQVRTRRVQPRSGVEVEALLSRLWQLGPGERAALWDAVERFWIACARDEQASTSDLLQAVGLIAPKTPSSTANRDEGGGTFRD